jgi:3-mercaptopyruvate sulfurtransferase SseA
MGTGTAATGPMEPARQVAGSRLGFVGVRSGSLPGAVAGRRLVDLQGTDGRDVTDQAEIEHEGVSADQHVITYCVRGGLSSHMWFTLTQMLGSTCATA